MKQITIRGISGEVEKAVRKEAGKKNLSLNKALLSLIEKGAGVRPEAGKKTVYHDLDRFCGAWPAEEASVFEKTLGHQRKIDERLWKRGE